jgi:predicted transcriptional regulator
MKEKLSNGKRFINCYNLIDSALRIQGDMKRSISYSEAVRRAARNNSIVAKYEDKLIDYGRLRNAIVHNSNDEFVIAEPHDKVVEDYEKITSLIITPPLAINTVAKNIVSCIEYDVKLKDVIEFDYTSGFSNIPIFKKGMLIGVANGQKILEVLGKKIFQKQDIAAYIENTSIEEVLKEFSNENYYAIANDKVTLDKVLNMFTENRKLLLVLITKNGTLLEVPLGIITISDIMDINRVLDNFNHQL